MLTLHIPVHDQADLDTLAEMGLSADTRGHRSKPVVKLNGTLLVLAVYAALALIALAVKYGPGIWRML